MMLILQLPGAAQISTTSALADSIGSIMTMNHIPGLIITVVSKDSIYWQKQMGYADLSNKACVEPSHLFKIGSVTKTFIALAIMKLVEEKKIGLAMRLSEIAPEIPFHNPWEKATPVRICDLLEHKAGFDDTHFSAMTDKSGKSARISAWDEVVANRKSLVSRWQPGLVHSYSNPGYVVLGYIIEKIAKMPYQEFIQKEVLAPLGMSHTYFINEMSAENSEQIAQGYSWYNGHFNPVHPFRFVGESAGALVTDTEDLQKFVQLFLKKGVSNHSGQISPGAIEAMEQVHGWYELKNKITNGYSFALHSWSVGVDHKVWFTGHSGGIWGFGTDFIYNRDIDLGIAVSNNGETGNKKILDLLVEHFTSHNISNSNAGHFPLAGKCTLPRTFGEWDGEYILMNSRNQIGRFLDVLFASVEIKIEHDSLRIAHPFAVDEYYRFVENNAFENREAVYPTLFLTSYEDKRVLYLNNDLYRPVNPVLFLLFRVLIVFSLALGITGTMFLIFQWTGLAIKRKSKHHILLTTVFVLPYLLIAILLWLFASLIPLHAITAAGHINIKTMLIFLITLLLPFLALANGLILFKKWAVIRKSAIKYYYSLLNFGSMVLVIYLAANGIFAIETWSY